MYIKQKYRDKHVSILDSNNHSQSQFNQRAAGDTLY